MLFNDTAVSSCGTQSREAAAGGSREIFFLPVPLPAQARGWHSWSPHSWSAADGKENPCNFPDGQCPYWFSLPHFSDFSSSNSPKGRVESSNVPGVCFSPPETHPWLVSKVDLGKTRHADVLPKLLLSSAPWKQLHLGGGQAGTHTSPGPSHFTTGDHAQSPEEEWTALVGPAALTQNSPEALNSGGEGPSKSTSSTSRHAENRNNASKCIFFHLYSMHMHTLNDQPAVTTSQQKAGDRMHWNRDPAVLSPSEQCLQSSCSCVEKTLLCKGSKWASGSSFMGLKLQRDKQRVQKPPQSIRKDIKTFW